MCGCKKQLSQEEKSKLRQEIKDIENSISFLRLNPETNQYTINRMNSRLYSLKQKLK